MARNALWGAALGAALLVSLPQSALSQEAPLDWTSSPNFKFNIHRVSVAGQSSVSAGTVTVVFSVTNPGGTAYNIMDTAAGSPFFSGGAARLSIDVGWNSTSWNPTPWGTTELVNTPSITAATQLLPRPWMNFTPPNPGGTGPAYPNTINALDATKALVCSASAAPCAGIAGLPVPAYYVTSVLPISASGSGRVGIEGHAVKATGTTDAVTLKPIYASIPIKAAFEDYAITGTLSARRKIVDFDTKCKACHDGNNHGTGIVPRLALHGGNRTEEPGLCVICHNPNQTDAAYRSSGAEESIDFKRLVHGIHAGGMRRNKLVIIGFKGSVNDFSTVRFPKSLRNCVTCHIDANGRGTFELPLASSLGSTVNSASVLSPLPGSLEVNPTNDLKISPIAAACSACHDDSEVRRHMISKGASFGAQQLALGGKEQCVNCHGRGREEDVRRAHDIGSSSRHRSSN